MLRKFQNAGLPQWGPAAHGSELLHTGSECRWPSETLGSSARLHTSLRALSKHSLALERYHD